MRRLRASCGLGIVMAAGETLAALALFSHDGAFLALQAVIAFLAGCALVLAPAPLRALPALPFLAIGSFHAARVLHESDGFGAVDYGLLAAHALLGVVVIWRLCGPARDEAWLLRALAVAAAAYFAQALWIARLVIPVTLTGERWTAPAVALAVTIVPLAAAWTAARAFDHRLRPSAAWSVAACVIAVPMLGYRPWLWLAHAHEVPAAAAPANAPPDVLLIVLDTVRADRTSFYGNTRPTTPSLERFAAGATLYERAQSQGIWTLPGHASLFTSLYPSEHRADWLEQGMNARGLSNDAVTLAERFDAAGWSTGCIAANKALFGEDFGLTQGFASAWAELGSTAQLWVPFTTAQVVHSLFGQRARERIGALEQNQFAPAQEVNRLALDWLERSAGNRPRFLFLNYMEAHGQLRRPPCAAPVFGDGRPFGEWDIPDAQIDAALAGRGDVDPALLERFRDGYDSQLACLDLHLGELFDELRARGWFDRMLIVVTSDHGHMLGDHRAFKHQAEIWQGLVGVPLLVKFPGQRSPARCEHVVQTADLARALPQWVAMTGASSPPCPLLPAHAFAVSEAGRMGELARKFPQRYDTSWTALLDGTKKFVVLADGSRRVADLASDPSETLRALTADESQRCDELMAQWRAGLVPQLGAGSRDQEEERRRLKALRQQGYVGK